MVRISHNEFVTKFSIPFLVDANFFLLSVFDKMLPCVRYWYSGPLAKEIAVRIGPRVSSACFMVGAVTTWCVDAGSHTKKYDCSVEAYIDLAAPLATIRYCLLTKRFLVVTISYRFRLGFQTFSSMK
ncbi:Uncharacterised protein [Chlamydia trachomatis]|nr:Uncharacterised protein [Chlamydia trachomatis]